MLTGCRSPKSRYIKCIPVHLKVTSTTLPIGFLSPLVTYKEEQLCH
jgi:hypothetical protein